MFHLTRHDADEPFLTPHLCISGCRCRSSKDSRFSKEIPRVAQRSTSYGSRLKHPQAARKGAVSVCQAPYGDSGRQIPLRLVE